MLCHEVKRVVYFFLDGTLPQQRVHDFSEHMSLCPDCQQRTTIHRRLRGFVTRRLQRMNASERFKQRLARSLRALCSES